MSLHTERYQSLAAELTRLTKERNDYRQEALKAWHELEELKMQHAKKRHERSLKRKIEKTQGVGESKRPSGSGNGQERMFVTSLGDPQFDMRRERWWSMCDPLVDLGKKNAGRLRDEGSQTEVAHQNHALEKDSQAMNSDTKYPEAEDSELEYDKVERDEVEDKCSEEKPIPKRSIWGILIG